MYEGELPTAEQRSFGFSNYYYYFKFTNVYKYMEKNNRGWFKKIDSISYVYVSRTVHDMWIMYINSERENHNFLNYPLERSPRAESCSSVGWEQNGYHVAQEFLHVSEEKVRRIQESFERIPRKSTRRASRELGIPQQTVWRVLRRRLLVNCVHLFESPCILKRGPPAMQWQVARVEM